MVDNLRDQLTAEQHVLFIKFRDEMAVKLNKEVGNMKAKLQRDLQVNNKAEPTMEEQQKMLVNMLANFKVSVCSRGTQVEEGELPLEKSTVTVILTWTQVQNLLILNNIGLLVAGKLSKGKTPF